MHPVARVSIKYWNNLCTQQSIFSARYLIKINKDRLDQKNDLLGFQ
jgi:hypothetical protein